MLHNRQRWIVNKYKNIRIIHLQYADIVTHIR